jgi:uncharacterized membrane protein
MSVDMALKYVVSMGVVAPVVRLRPVNQSNAPEPAAQSIGE